MQSGGPVGPLASRDIVFSEGTRGDILGRSRQERLSLPSQWWSHWSRWVGPLVLQLGA
jgi:hypothetical protein